jgi:hypothetical protein
MQVFSFKGTGRVFAFTPKDSAETLPAAYGPWETFKTLQMTSGQAIPGVNVDECLDDIDAHGFHLTDAHVRITEQAAGPST